MDDFEGWIETIKDSEPSSEVVVNYDFDREIIDAEDQETFENMINKGVELKFRYFMEHSCISVEHQGGGEKEEKF